MNTQRPHDQNRPGVQLLKDRAPDPVLERTARAALRLNERAARTARQWADRDPGRAPVQARPVRDLARVRRVQLLAGAAAVVVLRLAVGRGRRKR
ncbi:hypothetical protein [Kitasatospora sp. NPDC002040]|uniref:hypothetical protein n=1 Tax=Kitasatospora sp. NPDC002040 TaxID=3154661 RepID=UPI003325BB69